MLYPVELPITYPGRFYINGRWQAPSSSAEIDVVNPASENVFFRIAEAQAEDINRAVESARSAFDNGPWPRMPHTERASYLRAIAEHMRAHSEAFADLWSTEVGVVLSKSALIASAMASTFDFYASLAEQFPFEERHTPLFGGNIGLLVREPVGVVAAIIPWNGPLSLISYKIAPALLAGCTVVLKAPPEAPGAAYLMAEIADTIGLPAGVLNVLTADRDVSEQLVRHPGIDKVAFTGSSAAGRKIGALCAERVARCTLELGGKSAGIILDDYDLEAAAGALAKAAINMSGQVCSSITRIIVSRNHHDRFVERMADFFRTTRVGDPYDSASEMGPLASALQRARVEDYIAKGRAEGATLACGGGRPAHLRRGYYVEPTLFANVCNDMTVAREEIFGPVVCVLPADSEEEAVAIANDSPFGLNASVFTNDVERAYEIARRLRTGTVGHNSFRTDFSIAFGGFKQSGIGREGGIDGLLPYLEAKTVILDSEPAHLCLNAAP